MSDADQDSGPLIERVRRLQLAMASKDKAAFLACFAPDVEYHYHVGTRPLIGIDWVEKFLVKYWANHDDTSWVINHWAERGDRLFMEGVERYVNAAGDEVIHPYMGIAEFRDGLITSWREYFQMADPAVAG